MELEISVLELLFKLLALVLHMLHISARIVHIVLQLSLVILDVLFLKFGEDFIVEIVFGLWNTLDKVLERVLAETPLILDEKLLRIALG